MCTCTGFGCWFGVAFVFYELVICVFYELLIFMVVFCGVLILFVGLGLVVVVFRRVCFLLRVCGFAGFDSK